MATAETKALTLRAKTASRIAGYALIWAPLIVACLLFVLFMPGESRLHRLLVHRSLVDVELGSALIYVDSILHVAIIATVFLVAFGTWEFLLAIHHSIRRDWLTAVALRLTFATCIMSTLWGAFMFVPVTRTWLTAQHRTELLSLAIFGLFLIIDVLFMCSARKALSSAGATPADPDPKIAAKAQREAKELQLDFEFAQRSLWLIDVPVLFGVTAVLAISVALQTDGALRALTPDGAELFRSASASQKNAIFDSFLRGFATGSTTMHIAFSQFVFGILKTFDKVARARLT